MKKTLYILSVLLLGLVSCTKTPFDAPEQQKAEETGLVAVTMQLQVPQALQAFTKGDRAETPDIDYIKVAVFGTSGYPQTYALAEPVDASGNPVSQYATTNGDTYYFKVLLPVYEGEAHVHIIANGDESIRFADEDENSIMEAMKSENNVGAYWARLVMPDGILPTKDENGIMQTDTEGNFIPSDETKAFFGTAEKPLVLVRNFAEVLLINESTNLTDISWTLVNVPTMGSVAVMAGGTYVNDYADYTYDTSTGKMVNGTKVYEGFMFDNSMDYTVPTDDQITTPAGKPNFVYERTHPGSDKATCLLVKGKFNNGSTTDSDYTYYRLDLMDEAVGGYFPLYRNYKYQIKIHKVGNRGATTIAEAMNRDSGGNVSMSTEAKKLTDISDGASRLFVEYVEKNFTSGGKKGLWVQYIPDVSTGVVNNARVTVTVKEQGLALKEGTEITKTAESSDTGYYFYEFELNDQDENEDLTSVLQVKADNGETGDDKSTLYRDVTLRVMKKMDMTLSLVPKKVTGITTTILNIGLPEGLPSSMFPLEIYIEDINHTLNPTQEDGNGNAITVPVKTAKSLADGTTNSFYFIRTVNESEYLANNTISTQFTTIANASATTIYVANEYFKTHSINLLNDGIYVNPLNATVDFNVTEVEIEVESDDQTKTWTVTAGSGVTVDVSETQTGNGTFKMTFAQNSSTTADVKRTATVRSDGVDHVVTITQKALQFSITPATQTFAFNATTATVKVNAGEGMAWTASVNNGAELSAISGTGTQTLTVTMPVNTGNQRSFTVTATMTSPAATATATITQRIAPASPYPFNASSFTINNYNGNATSSDGYVSIALTQAQRSTGQNPYLTMGRDTGRFTTTHNRGTISVIPQEGFKITQIKVTYSDATYANYDFGNTPVEVNTGTYTRDGNNSNTATWTGSSTDTITFTNGYQTNYGSANYPRIRSIEVTYVAI